MANVLSWLGPIRGERVGRSMSGMRQIKLKDRLTVTLDDDPTTHKVIEKATSIPSLYFSSPKELFSQVRSLRPLAAFIDLHLGGFSSGFEVLPALKKSWPYCPLMVVTSDTSEEAVRDALELGADDFIRKPINPVEISARLRARLGSLKDFETKTTLVLGDLTLNIKHRLLKGKHEERYLSPTALSIFQSLIEAEGTLVTRQHLKANTWGRIVVTDNALDRKISDLRKTLSEVSHNIEIETVYREGFKLKLIGKASKTTEKVSLEPTLAESAITKNEATAKRESSSKTEPVIKIVLIEDSPADTGLVQEALGIHQSKTDYELHCADTVQRGKELINQQGPNVVLLDLHLPDYQGLDVFWQVHNAFPELPVITLSGSFDDELALATVAAGAQDFLSKSQLNPWALPRSIRYAIARKKLSEVEQQKMAAEAEVFHQKQKAEAEALHHAAELKAQFLASMSHEIRTPMNGVIGTVSLLLTTELSEEQKGYVETIKSSGETLLKTINEILDHSKLEASKMELENFPFKIRSVIENVISLFAEQAQRKSVFMTDHVDKRIPIHVSGDATRLQQIISNITSNALKFTEKGEVVLSAQLEEQDDKRIIIRFEVKDTGVGIAKKDHQKLFQPFSQADSSTTRKYGGTGLGLCISKRLVENMGGEIGFDSDLGKGTTFWFTIPFEIVNEVYPVRSDLKGKRVTLSIKDTALLCNLEEHLKARGLMTSQSLDYASDVIISQWDRDSVTQALDLPCLYLINPGETLPDSPSKRGQYLRLPLRQSELYKALADLIGNEHKDISTNPSITTLPQFSNELVLVCEDNPVNQKLTIQMLKKLNLSCDVVSNGLEALDALREEPRYQVILMDCMMPELDGFSATNAIREQLKLKTPIVGMTALAFKSDIEACIKSGMNDALIKPVQLEDLSKALSMWLMPSKATYPVTTPDRNSDYKSERLGKDRNLNESDKNAINDPLSQLDEKTLIFLKECGRSDSKFVVDLLDLFFSNAPSAMEKLRAAIEIKDIKTTLHAAHHLKGLFLNLGAFAVGNICNEIESGARNGSLEKALVSIKQVEETYPKIRAALTRWRDL